MINRLQFLPLCIIHVGLIALALPAASQVPNTLRHAIPAPLLGMQSGAQLGRSVAVDGGFTVVGAPYDDLLGLDSGVVKVFDSVTGAMLLVIPNPSPAASDLFGYSVAISGTRVVIGAYQDDTGATDAGCVYVYDLSSTTPDVPVTTLTNPDPALDESFGFSVAIDGVRVVIGMPLDGTGAPDAGGAYVYDLGTATPTVPMAKLNNPSPVFSDWFGYSVAISGTRVVIGVPQDDPGGRDTGSAYAYDISRGTPTVPLVMFTIPGATGFARSGASVAISGTRVIIGSPWNFVAEFDSGSATVFDLASTTPTSPVATLVNPSPAPNDHFGISIAISGARVVVGAHSDNTWGDDSGSAYVFNFIGPFPSTPVLLLTLNNPTPAVNDNFGWSVAIDTTRVVIGAYGDNTSAVGAGSAYVYNFASGTPTVPAAALSNPGLASLDSFGFSVAISGSRMVVGAPLDETGATNAGSAYVYDLAGSTPSVPVATLHNPSPAANDQFGYSVAISGTRIVIGAPLDDVGPTEVGTAYAYDLSSATPTVPIATLNNPAPAFSDQFGSCVAISGTRVAVGARFDDAGVPNAGTVYVYELSDATPSVLVTTLNNPSPAVSDQFGNAVAISGTWMVVGASADDTIWGTNTGTAYVYDLSSPTPTLPVITFDNPEPAIGDQFGYSVAISGTRVAISAPYDDLGADDAGSAFVYDLASLTPNVPVATFNDPGLTANDRFGNSLAISGTLVLVASVYDDTGATDAGRAFVYDLSSGTPAVPISILNNPSPAVNDQFGLSVAIDGAIVGIGTPNDDSVAIDKGFAYVFGPPAIAPLVSALGNVIKGEFAPNGAGANDSTKFDVLKRGGFLAENGMLVFPGTLLVGTGGVTPATSMGLWKHDNVSLKLFARSGNVAPESGNATFDVLPVAPAINDSGKVTFLASLLVGSGAPATTADTDTGLWSELGSTPLGILMRESDAIPGLGGIQVGAFASGAFATAHTGPTTGEAVFSITMKNGSTDTAILRASVTGPTVTAVQVLARQNTAMPGVAGELFGALASSYTDPAHMDAAGNVVFGAVSKTNKESVWYQPVAPAGGAPAKVFITGEPAPGTGGATFQSMKSPTIGDGGVITFRGFLNANGDNASGLRNDGIWRGTGSNAASYTCILRRGDSGLPGMPALSKVGNLWHSWLTNLNHGAWLGWLDINGDGTSSTAAGDVTAVYTDLSGTMSMLIKAGDAAPGVAGATMASFDLPIVGGAQQAVFLGKLTLGGAVTGTNNGGVWRTAANGGALSLLIRTGDAMTTTQGVKTIQKLDFPGSNSTQRRWEQPVIDATGRVLIFVTFTDGSTSEVLAP